MNTSIILWLILIIIALYAVKYVYDMTQIETFDTTTTTSIPDTVYTNLYNQLAQLQTNFQNNNLMTGSSMANDTNFVNNFTTQYQNILQTQDASVKASQKANRQTLQTLKNKIKNYKTQLGIKSSVPVVKSIISRYNGQPLTLIPVADDRGLVIINDKCLSTNSVGNYELAPCNYLDTKQHFQLISITGDIDYNSQIMPSMPKIANETDINGNPIKYPLYIVKSVISDNCLSNIDSNIYLDVCYATPQQMWDGTDKLFVCPKKKKT